MTSDAHITYAFDGFCLDPRRRLLTCADGTPVQLAGQAFDALLYLVRHAGELVTRAALAEALWPTTIVEENSLNQAVSTVRRAIGDGYIVTVPRRGYQFVADVQTVAAQSDDADPAALPHVLVAANETQRRRRALLIGAAAAIAVIAIVSLSALRLAAPSADADPLRAASYRRLTDFEGAEEHAAVSRDGRLVAFLSDRDGRWDVWVGQIGAGDFRNLTNGSIAELRNPAVRTLGFEPDGGLVLIWTRRPSEGGGAMVDAGWAVPTLGGVPRPYLPGIAELDWSQDQRRIAYHTSAEGDPLFVTGENDREGRQVYVAPRGVHSHFPVWSADAKLIYFVKGGAQDENDVWQVPATGGEPERLTLHNSRVSFPTLLDKRTLLYLATAPDGSGPWVHALDLDRRVSRRLNTGVDEYRSLAASADGRRIVATVATSTSRLWRAALGGAPLTASTVTPIAVSPARATSPRSADGVLLFRAPKAGVDALWKVVDGTTSELWSAADARVAAAPALAPDGRRAAFPVQRGGATRLYIIGTDGRGLRQAAELDVRGAPAWSPDGRWVATAALHNGVPRLYRIPADGGAAVALGDDYALDPVWSPSGEFLVYSGADVGTNFALGAVSFDGAPEALPQIELSRGSRRLDFLGATDTLVLLKGSLSHKEFWAVNLDDGSERQLSDLGTGEIIGDFDVSADGREIVLDRGRDVSDIVLIDLPPG
jgi:Tol biopolymer transport system component/DNA-binding winged helix-turn-helix (wHTH) protein